MTYQRPAVLASYSEEELVAEAAVCTGYGEHTEKDKKGAKKDWWKRWFGHH